jgi:hypothetical protein
MSSKNGILGYLTIFTLGATYLTDCNIYSSYVHLKCQNNAKISENETSPETVHFHPQKSELESGRCGARGATDLSLKQS